MNTKSLKREDLKDLGSITIRLEGDFTADERVKMFFGLLKPEVAEALASAVKITDAGEATLDTCFCCHWSEQKTYWCECGSTVCWLNNDGCVGIAIRQA